MLGATALLPGLVAAQGRGRRLVVVHAWGGWDVTFALDPKDRAEVDGPFVDEDALDPTDRATTEVLHGIPVLCDDRRRPAVTTFFERWGDRTALINGLQIGAVGHPDGVRRILCGSADLARPDLTAILGAHDDGGRAVGNVDLAGAGYPGTLGASGLRVGPGDQLAALLDPGARPPGPSPVRDTPQGEAEQAAIRAYLREAVERRRPHLGEPGQAQLDDRLQSLDRAEALHGSSLVMPQGARGLEADVQRCLAMLDADLGRAYLLDSRQPWDSHVDQARQHDAYDAFFAGLDALLAGIEAGGHDDVVVAVVSEMARSPRRNIEGGTEHWPVTSAMLLGAGVNGGRVLGGTDAGLRARPVDLPTGDLDDAGDLITYDALCAGLLAHCDVDPAAWLPAATPFLAPYS